MDINTGSSTAVQDLMRSVHPERWTMLSMFFFLIRIIPLPWAATEQSNKMVEFQISWLSIKDFLKDAKLHIISHNEKPTIKIIYALDNNMITCRYTYFLQLNNTKQIWKWSLNNHTLSSSNTLDNTVFPLCEVVVISPATSVVKHLTFLGIGVVCKPPLCALTCSPVHRTEAQLCRLQVCKSQ